MIFAWWGIGGRAPQWNLPADQPDQAGWSDLQIRSSRFPGHPQEVTENSVPRPIAPWNPSSAGPSSPPASSPHTSSLFHELLILATAGVAVGLVHALAG